MLFVRLSFTELKPNEIMMRVRLKKFVGSESSNVWSAVKKDLSRADYITFSCIIRLREADLITTNDYREKLQYLLRNHPKTVDNFNQVSHPNLRIEHKPPSYYKGHLVESNTLAESIAAANYIKKRCGEDVEKYKKFLNVMEAYNKNGVKNVEGVYEEIYDLFKGDVAVAKKIGSLFELFTPSYVYLPEKYRERIWEFEDMDVDIESSNNKQRINFKASDVLNNTSFALIDRHNGS